MTEWAALLHGYGTAEDIPALLVAAEDSGLESGLAWDEVWSRLYHQGTVYTASYAALPLLADMAERHPPAGYVAALHLAAAIVASTDGRTDPALMRQEHAYALRRFHDLALRNLPLAEGDTEFVYGLQALLAFEDGGVWQRHLSYVADGELPLECPNCGELLILNLDGPEYALASYTDGSIPPTPVQPSEPTEESVEERMLALSRNLGRSEVVSKIRYIIGSATCPSCHTIFEIPDTFT